MREEIRVTREELYMQVWSVPMTKVAARYWISDVGLKKRCKLLDIPTPPRGYWAKVAQGEKPPKKPLRQTTGKLGGTVFYRRPVVRKRPHLPSVIKPEDFERPLHPVVRETVRTLQSHGGGSRQPALELHVKPWRLERPAALLSALFYAVERQGYEVAVVSGDQSYSSIFLVDGEKINFYVTEELRYRRDPGQRENDSELPNVQVQALEFNFRLWHCPHEGKTRWRDSRRLPLEEQLDEIVGELIPLSASIRCHRLEVERQQAERAENQRRVQAAEDQLSTLKLDIQGSRFAEEVRAFVKRTGEFVNSSSQSERFLKWKDWAMAIADQNDPLMVRRNDPLARYFKCHDQLWRRIEDDDGSG